MIRRQAASPKYTRRRFHPQAARRGTGGSRTCSRTIRGAKALLSTQVTRNPAAAIRLEGPLAKRHPRHVLADGRVRGRPVDGDVLPGAPSEQQADAILGRDVQHARAIGRRPPAGIKRLQRRAAINR
jgi:hypothetical protein